MLPSQEALQESFKYHVGMTWYLQFNEAHYNKSNFPTLSLKMWAAKPCDETRGDLLTAWTDALLEEEKPNLRETITPTAESYANNHDSNQSRWHQHQKKKGRNLPLTPPLLPSQTLEN